MTGLLKHFRLSAGEIPFSAAQARRRRTRRLAAIFVSALIIVTGFGAAKVSCIDTVRAAADLQWSKAQTCLVAGPLLYGQLHDPDDFSDFNASRDTMRSVLILLASMSLVSLAGLLLLRGVALLAARAEERAEESEARIRDFAEVAADWFCELDCDLKIAYMSNRYFAESLPVGGDWIGMPWFQSAAKFGFWSLSDANRARLAAREPFHDHRFRLLTPEGRALYWSLSGKPVLDKRGAFAGYRIAARDITALVRTQEEFAVKRDIAEQANRAKSAFIARMGHELRSPLMAVLGFSEIIGREMLGRSTNAKYAEYGRDIHNAAEKLLDTLNDVLDLASIEAGHLVLRDQEFALWDVIEAMLRNCRAASRKSGVALIANVPSTLPCLRADPRRIRQLLIHLVLNAIQFTPIGGRVTLETRRAQDGDFSIIVRDDGIGMNANEIGRALQPFSQPDCRPDRKFEGASLGLSIANMIANYHGGTLHVASAPGKGTIVTFTLPAVRVLQSNTMLSA